MKLINEKYEEPSIDEVENISDIIYDNNYGDESIDELEISTLNDLDYYYSLIKNVDEAEKFNYHSDYWGYAEDYQEQNIELIDNLRPFIGKKVQVDYDDGSITGKLLGIAIDRQYNSISHTKVILDSIEEVLEEGLTESIHKLNSIEVPGYMNTWSSIDVYDVTVGPGKSKRYFLMENDKYGDETQYLVVSEDLSEIYETYDDIETALRDEGILESLNESTFASGWKGESLKENIGQDIAEYQKWVDYDMKKYGRISKDTNEKIREAGLKIVKDKYGNYEVIANEPIRESLSNDELNNMIAISHKIGLNTLDDLRDFLKRESHPNETVIDTLNRYSKEFDSNESLKEDINMDSTTIDKSKIKFNINDDGDFTFTVDGKEYKGHTDKPQDMSKDLKNFGFDLTEDFNSENGPKIKDTGIAQLLIDAINGEWDTIKLYNDIVTNLEEYGYKDISDVIKDIVIEENIHIGQLQKALETISPNVSSIEDGVKEAEGQLADTTEANELNNYEEDK